MSVTVSSRWLNVDLLRQGEVAGADGLQTDVARLLAQRLREAQHQLLAAVAVDVAGEGGVLDTVQTIVLAPLGDLVPDLVVRYVVDQDDITHLGVRLQVTSFRYL